MPQINIDQKKSDAATFMERLVSPYTFVFLLVLVLVIFVVFVFLRKRNCNLSMDGQTKCQSFIDWAINNNFNETLPVQANLQKKPEKLKKIYSFSAGPKF